MNETMNDRLTAAIDTARSNESAAGKAHVSSLHEKASAWLPGDPVDFLLDFALGEGADAVALLETDAVTEDNFVFYMKKKQTKKKLADLLKLWKQEPSEERLAAIDAIGLKKWLARVDFREGSKPWDLLNRLHVMLFISDMTTLVDDKQLTELYKALIASEQTPTSFVRRQVAVRQAIDSEIAERELELDPFAQASIARFI
ncbi:hypothetical protein [Exiguobacterium flavidum]|uniref:hypothetical protein n=1 Tax=Exiguobacterium flavidum TaxID=2184695 RepID=UPI000DF73428|nr:hypothetical protein [Exiguobacterium flavidum]